MFDEAVDLLMKEVNYEGDEVEEFSALFRSIAGNRISECADVNGVLERYGIVAVGSNTELTKEIYLNTVILMSSDEGDSIYLSDNRAVLFAGKDKKKANVLGKDEVCSWFLKAVGLESSTDEEYEDDGEWGSEEDEEPVDEDSEAEEDAVEEHVEEEEEVEETSDRNFEEDRERIRQYYYRFSRGLVDELAKRYTSLFESGYEVVTPAGILSKDGLVGLSGSKLVVKKFDVSVVKMYKLFSERLQFVEVPHRSNVKIANTIYESYIRGERRLLYFPNKLLEYTYGRKAPSGDNRDSLNTYEPHASSSNWKAYCDSEVVKSLMSVVEGSVVKFIYLSARDGNYFDDRLTEELEGFLRYLQSCLSLCLLMVEYKFRSKGYSEDVYSFKVRVCDPENYLGSMDLTMPIIKSAFAGSTGDVPFSYKPRFEDETFIKEYAHEFNRNSSQASPLFAYKAYLALQSQGVSPTWNNMILGMFEDGTVLKNGKHGVSLESRLTHHISAGSRSGKGVMTLNILASGIYSRKSIFYLDRKPDMASLFKSLSPSMFVVNGGGYGDQYDTYHQFENIDSVVNWGNVPDYVVKMLGVPKCWDSLGDLFYMRALKLVMGIIVARGDGQLDNPKLGGKEGILLVVDEFKNFQESFSGIVEKVLGKIPPSTYLIDKGKLENDKLKDYEKAKLLRDFDLSYNNSSMYAVTYLNSLVSDLEYLSTKRDAGFNQKEIELSDIFVIGQHLKHGSLDFRLFRSLIDDSSSSGRYKSAGRTGVSSSSNGILSKIGVQTSSFPFSMVSFKTCDAFFGKNTEEGRGVYLAQENESSKAYGRLDEKASNFAYLGSFTEDTRAKIVSGNVAANLDIASRCIYFKPFLVLNDAKPGDLYTEGMFKRCAGEGNTAGKEWVSREEIIAENPNDDGTFVNSAVGFEGYLELMGAGDYREILAKSSKIADYVVRDCLGYPGNWFEFITDLRPQWCFTVKDIVDACNGIEPALLNVETNPVVSEFVRFNPNEFGLGGSVETQDGFGDSRSVSEFMDDRYTDYSDMGMQKASVDVAMDSLFGDEGEENEDDYLDDEVALFDEDQAEEEDFYTPIKEDKVEETGFGEDVKDIAEGVGSSDDEVEDLLRRLEALGVRVVRPQKQTEIDFDLDPEYGARPVGKYRDGYKEFDSADETEFNDRVEFNGGVESYADLVNLISNDIVRKFGGLEEIVSFKVVGGSIVVNGYYYRCRAGELFARNIPYDIRKELNSGNIGRLFNYNLLLYMPRLRDLEFDSTTFVYDYVSYGMGYGSKISVDLFFKDIPSLQCLCIGRKLFKRNSYMEQIRNDDVFYHPRLATKYANISEDLLGKASRSSWEFTKNTMKSKDYGKVMKFLGVSGGLVATGASFGGRVAIKGSRKVFNGLGRGLRQLSSSFMDIMEDSKK